MESYTDVRLGLMPRVVELYSLYRLHIQRSEQQVRDLLSEAVAIKELIEEKSDRPLQGADILEIGPGQRPIQLTYFGQTNRALGIDTDYFPQKGTLLEYSRMWRENGSIRTMKTAARKVLGIDRRISKHVRDYLGVASVPAVSILKMDAAAMDFNDCSFDAVYSRAVFEHLPCPEAVVREIHRVLRPGGTAIITLHLYTCDSGCHDARILMGQRGQLPHWAHLRPQYSHLVRENSYLNRYSLERWRDLFKTELPGSDVHAMCDAPVADRQELLVLRKAGELSSYSDDELLSSSVQIRWTKPTIPARPCANCQ